MSWSDYVSATVAWHYENGRPMQDGCRWSARTMEAAECATTPRRFVGWR